MDGGSKTTGVLFRLLGYKNGDRYEGEFKNGEIKGIGIYYYSNGDVEIKTYLEGIKI